MARCLSSIRNLTVREQAPIWAEIEDDLLLDLDLGVGFDITVTDLVRVCAACRLEAAGLVVLTALGAELAAGVKVARVAPIRAVRKVA